MNKKFWLRFLVSLAGVPASLAFGGTETACRLREVKFRPLTPIEKADNSKPHARSAKVDELKVDWPIDDGSELKVTVGSHPTCTIPDDNFLISVHYAKATQTLLVVTDVGASSCTQNLHAYDALTCKSRGPILSRIGFLKITGGRLINPAHCIDADYEYSCAPASVYDFDDQCQPKKNAPASADSTRKTLGYELMEYRSFQTNQDPLFLKLNAHYQSQRK